MRAASLGCYRAVRPQQIIIFLPLRSARWFSHYRSLQPRHQHQKSTPQQPQHRSFITDALTPAQTLSASRNLPYSAKSCYELIADISAYPQFIPYCTSSAITSYSEVESRTSHRRWPRTADLHVGYGPYHEVFRSKVYCLPYRVLEAVSGQAETTLSHSDIPHYGMNGADGGESDANMAAAEKSALFSSLLTRWTFREHSSAPQQGSLMTEVNLVIEVRFASPVYAALSQAAAPKVAGMMVGAFEARAKEVLRSGD